MPGQLQLIQPEWPAPKGIKAFSTTRLGGISPAPYASFNLGLHVGDDPANVLRNRQQLRAVAQLPNEPLWLNQVHGTVTVDVAQQIALSPEPQFMQPPEADASFSRQAKQVCLVMTADCLPVLFCDLQGCTVAAAHAGWRGLLNGVLEQSIQQFSNPAQVLVWLGPAIGPGAFEVGAEVKAAFMQSQATAEAAFVPSGNSGKWLADIYLLARLRLQQAGVTAIYGGGYCTYQQQEHFFSYRRDGQTGRMASFIWIE